VEWLSDDQRQAKWAELGITLDDFSYRPG
jgi:hypothetical protein